MDKKIAVHVDPNYSNSYSKKWIEYIDRAEGYKAFPVNMKSVDIMEIIKDCCGVMWHYRHTPIDKQVAPQILSTIEECLHIPVWPNRKTRWHFDEKVAQHYLFSVSNVPHIKSWVFWEKEEAERFINSTDDYPLVFKLSVGAGSANVIKIDGKVDAKIYVDRMFDKGIFPYTENEYRLNSMEGAPNFPEFSKRMKYGFKYIHRGICVPLPWYYQIQKDYVYFQKFIPNNGNDIRITVIGNRAFGFIRYNRPNDFRASGSGKLVTDPSNIPLEAVKIAHDMSERNGFQSMAYDFLMDNQQPLLNEMSYCYVNHAVHECPGYWDRNLEWHEGHTWPEEAHVEDFINYINKRA